MSLKCLKSKNNRLAQNDETNQSDEWLNSQQAADLFLIKKDRLYNMVHMSLIPHYKLGKLLRFKKSELLQLLTQKKATGNLWSNMTKKQKHGKSKSVTQITKQNGSFHVCDFLLDRRKKQTQ